jgi:hypothetical protein
MPFFAQAEETPAGLERNEQPQKNCQTIATSRINWATRIGSFKFNSCKGRGN